MIDNFMSGWGQAANLINIYLVECASQEEAEQIKKAAKRRDEMSNIKICATKPYYSPKTHLVSAKHYNDLGGVWKEDENGKELVK
jgi:hypothetical protein